jgi:hypothetical protein
MPNLTIRTFVAFGGVCLLLSAGQAEPGKPYRLEPVDLNQRVIWGAEVLAPDGHGLAFGGQDQRADDGRPHTRVRLGEQWQPIGERLRTDNPLQGLHARAWTLRGEVKDLCARMRAIYFKGLPQLEEAHLIREKISPEQRKIVRQMYRLAKDFADLDCGDSYLAGQVEIAIAYLNRAGKTMERDLRSVSAEEIRLLREAQVQMELLSEALDAEPAGRSIDCGRHRGEEKSVPGSVGLIYDPESKVYVLFGGDHMDYLTNDTWVFDPDQPKWSQRHPQAGAPPPRANHRMESIGAGRVRLTGGYSYTSNTDYVGGQYADLNDGEWIYDIAKDKWAGGKLVPADSRTYRSGPFHPDFFLQDEKPDAAAFESRLRALPANEWVATDPPYRPSLNRDWGQAVIDPDHDLMLRWSGGHSAHGGSDVPQFHFSTNRWELPFPVEFPLGQLYSNTSYPDGFNYNRRPWITGHTYQNYQYDPLSKLMVKAGRPRNHFLYDPAIGDWVGSGAKPRAMCYDSCFYTLTLVSTPRGIFCWDKDGRVHRFEAAAKSDRKDGLGAWAELELGGVKLAGSVVDNSTIAYDSKRDRVLVVSKPYGDAPYDGRVWAIDLKTNRVEALSPGGMERARRFAFIDRCVYDPASDLVIMASYLNDSEGAATRTPAFDCANQRWVTLDLKYATGKRGEQTTRAFPHGRSCGIMFDPKRRLIWGTDTDSQIYVLRLEVAKANLLPL